MAEEKSIDVEAILGDDVITSCALKQLNDQLSQQDEDEQLLDGQ